MSQIGQHKVGKFFTQIRYSVIGGLKGIVPTGAYKHTETMPHVVNGVTAEQLPPRPNNPYRKRPVKLHYDRNEYHTFRLPSEKAFQFANFEYSDMFGKRTGLVHAPHLKAQQDMDTNLVLFFLGFCMFSLIIENKRTHDIVTLRENMINSDMGFFPSEDD
eukprot:CAMPEP_0170492430 /NCGR_PEP_ID=MMETSP0208-20121228/12235_1 /TAXON_ID=197538 /ORGANISM="Strombidium inclinatum, Strain S3" /LENGTH=159 /DNA_ID=CAMNT_0010768165 /DNA_START=6 /DNA_END=482 /DNA_ORIENTATION=+